ncbi:BTB/POZ domain-containing protein 16-like [Corticium candelabrum]|uniref:BTB/POZ domain-containing protein 16-like n=1 Tax=Corticium candelabrum TaxID=121492 RepID=UPI002E2705F8|nr:BTB/POZ domain-containing protein 16-like [Corticium candelabrum]
MDSLCIKSAPVMEPECSEGPSPTSIFHYHSKRAIPTKGPDVLLQCHGITRELHKPYIRKSHTLSGLLQHAVISATACYEDSLPVISLPFSYTNVTQQSLARALGLLYEDQFTVSPEEVVSVLAAASLLLYPELQKECCEVMLRCINVSTVSMYYLASTKVSETLK